MEVTQIIAQIDAQIAKLEQAKTLLAGSAGEPAKRRGRPKGSKNVVKAPSARKTRTLSPEGRKRIADAMKRRWASRRKSAAV